MAIDNSRMIQDIPSASPDGGAFGSSAYRSAPASSVRLLCAIALLALLSGCNKPAQPAATTSPVPTPAADHPTVETPVPATKIDIVGWFDDYYDFAVADLRMHRDDYLPVIHNALAAGATSQAMLKDESVAHVDALDRKVGYLSVSGVNDDSELTMATYQPDNGEQVLVVDSSICVDACSYRVDVFGRDAKGNLASLPAARFFPDLKRTEFLVPGAKMPPQVMSIKPMLRYLPMPNGRDIEVSTFFGPQFFEDRALWSPELGGVMGTVTLHWDAALGKFVRP